MHSMPITQTSVPERIFKLGMMHPNRSALRYGAEELTYRELDERADRFASYLIQRGVLSDDTVAICMERSFEWIISALGIMRAGAAYVPLDPAWPDSRLAFAIGDSGAAAVIAPASLQNRLQLGMSGIDPQRDAFQIGTSPRLEKPMIRPESVAYVAYTSGSTGFPKGVEITHANLAHLIHWHQETFEVTHQDRASHLAGLGFDAAVWELWPNLTAGACLCLADDAIRSSRDLIQKWIIREKISICFVPTVHANSLIAAKWPQRTPLRLLLTGGDTLHSRPTEKLPFQVVNNYGPTECTVVAISGVIGPSSIAADAPSIGRPITGAKIYLLDETGQQVSDGLSGEIYVGGNGVGRRYRNLPELTRQSFLPDPFAEEPGKRMYRTGDRGRRLPNGEIEFNGRLDRQTKIRGQRVELDEIGNILCRHPGVDFAVATVDFAPNGEKQLVAYVLPKKAASLSSRKELQEHLLESLPDYMIPATFVRLFKLPLSASGKVDLKLLPPLAEAQLLDNSQPQQPVTPTEKKLLAEIREILGNDAVTINENFFLAGGHSLLGMQLVIRLRTVFGVSLSLRELFETPTVERLASLIETMMELSKIWANVLGLEQVGLDQNFFNLSGNPALAVTLQQKIAVKFGLEIPRINILQTPTVRQQANIVQELTELRPVLPPGVIPLQQNGKRGNIFWVHYLNGNLAKAMEDKHPFLAVQLTPEDLITLGEAPQIESIADCLVRKIVATQTSGPYTIGGFCLGAILAYEIAAQLRATGREVFLLVLVDPPNPSYLAQSRHPLTPRLSNPRYLFKRIAKLGFQKSVSKIRDRVREATGRSATSGDTGLGIGQTLIETAAAVYNPPTYREKVLLLLAADRPPHLNFEPGWRAIIPGTLSTYLIYAHHSEFSRLHHAREIAEIISSHLVPTSKETSQELDQSPYLKTS